MVMHSKLKTDGGYAYLVAQYRAAKRAMEAYEKAQGWHKEKAWTFDRRIALKREYLVKLHIEAQEFLTQASLAGAKGEEGQKEHALYQAQRRVYTISHHKKLLEKLLAAKAEAASAEYEIAETQFGRLTATEKTND